MKATLLRGPLLRSLALSALSAFSLLAGGCSSLPNNEPLLIDGFFKADNIGGARDCIPLAHSKRFKKIVYSCSPASLNIISTDTGNSKYLKLNMYLDPFIYQTESTIKFYFPSNAQNAAIREIDGLTGSVFDRPIIVQPNLRYREVYINPRGRCMAISLDENEGKFPERVVIKAYDYDPAERTPIVVGGRGQIEVTKGENLSSLGGANNNRLACVRDKSGQMVLYVSRLEQDFQRGKPGGMIWRYTESSEKLIFSGPNSHDFFQPKIDNLVFARDRVSAGLMQINTDTGEISKIGENASGIWEDYDPSTRTGVLVSTLHPDYLPFFQRHGEPRAFVRICVAKVDDGNCIIGAPLAYSNSFFFTPSMSSGWLGDGFIYGSSKNIFVGSEEDFKSDIPAETIVGSYWN